MNQYITRLHLLLGVQHLFNTQSRGAQDVSIASNINNASPCTFWPAVTATCFTNPGMGIEYPFAMPPGILCDPADQSVENDRVSGQSNEMPADLARRRKRDTIDFEPTGVGTSV